VQLLSPSRHVRRPMLTLLTVWLAACAALLCLFAPTASAAPAAAVRLMPLGDSITAGSNIAGAYRTRLWQRATTDHRQDDFVGSQKGGPSQLGDLDHEGHPGWRIEQLDAQIAGWLATYKPQTILLHIGTNDITQNYDVAGAPARLSTLIDHITANAPTAEVFISNIVPFVNPGVETRAKPYNAAVPGIVSQWAAKGKHVHFVDMHSALTTADISPDGVHPSATGYSKMGDRWYQTLTTGPWI
jgi:lysophospholipase L1-like esterase